MRSLEMPLPGWPFGLALQHVEADRVSNPHRAGDTATRVASPTALLGSIGVVGTYRPEKDGPTTIVSRQSPLETERQVRDED